GVLSDTATVSVTVSPVADAPVAHDDTATLAEDSSATTVDVLGNDTDVDNLTPPANAGLSVASATNGAHGTVAIALDGLSVSYTPAANYNGPDSFTYTVTDGGLTSTATVSITVTAVNDAPVATGDAFSTNEDTPLHVAAPGVLGNDTDVDGDALSAVLVGDVARGSLTLHADGSFDSSPAGTFNGSDSFTYKANDGTADSN